MSFDRFKLAQTLHYGEGFRGGQVRSSLSIELERRAEPRIAELRARYAIKDCADNRPTGSLLLIAEQNI